MKLSFPLGRGEKKQLDPKPGLYSYVRQGQGERVHTHLRIHADGRGLLLINANRSFHLNTTATAIAYFFLEGRTEKETYAFLKKRYHVEEQTAREDVRSLRSQIEDLLVHDGLCPIHDLELEILPPFSKVPAAPYRMDLALTYRCNCRCTHCYNARSRDFPELETSAWKQILEMLWQVGIPHICFTGGEATLREDLPELISYAQSLGQITGLLSNGRRLSDKSYVRRLMDAGLDHVQITLESHDEAIHDHMVQAKGSWNQTVGGIRNALDSDLYVMTNTTLLNDNAPYVEKTLRFLAELGVPTVGFNALIYAGSGKSVGTGLPEHDLKPLLERVREWTERSGQRLIWYTPTQYCHFDPVQMELGVKGCTAAMYNMCVEPNGDVIPCQSYYQPVGNLQWDPWDSIWNHELSVWLRERQYIPEKCEQCAVLQECGGGCPLSLLHQRPLSREEVLFSL